MLRRGVYLAGPVAGLTHDEARFGWRKEFADMLPPEIPVFSPLRGISDGYNGKVLDYKNQKNITGSWFVERDLYDIIHCDAVVANFKGSESVSIGTVFELGSIYRDRKPFIIIDDWDREAVHRHPFLEQLAYEIVDNLEDARDSLCNLLLPGV